MRELIMLFSAKSMIRYLLPKGTAGLVRFHVSGCSREPLPPASTMPMTLTLRDAMGASVLARVRTCSSPYQLGDEGEDDPCSAHVTAARSALPEANVRPTSGRHGRPPERGSLLRDERAAS